MKILGIETSCDETAVALYDSERHRVVHNLSSQIHLHNHYGGVIPELASRDHGSKLLPLVKNTLHQGECALNEISGIAYTTGPGLAGALLVGATFGRSLAWALNLPALEINHLEAHVMAVMLENISPTYPFLALLVSGGHTLLVKVTNESCYEVLGATLDDAVGECFDKTAKLLGLSYPGGPQIAELAKRGLANRFQFPKPMLHQPNLDFSFSGLKTHIRLLWGTLSKTKQDKYDVARALEDTIVQVLVFKCKKAIEITGIKQIALVGGVAANQSLRKALDSLVQQHQGKLYYPRPEYCTDNGAMVAYAGYCRLKQGKVAKNLVVTIHPRWSLTMI